MNMNKTTNFPNYSIIAASPIEKQFIERRLEDRFKSPFSKKITIILPLKEVQMEEISPAYKT